MILTSNNIYTNIGVKLRAKLKEVSIQARAHHMIIFV